MLFTLAISELGVGDADRQKKIRMKINYPLTVNEKNKKLTNKHKRASDGVHQANCASIQALFSTLPPL